MNYQDRDPLGIYKSSTASGMGPHLMGANTLIGNDVYNHNDEDLGEIKEIMLAMRSGKVAYAVLSFGGILGMGEKLFAVPWAALILDTENKRFVLNVEKETLKNAPGFDKDNWPNMADASWTKEIHSYYGIEPDPDAIYNTIVQLPSWLQISWGDFGKVLLPDLLSVPRCVFVVCFAAALTALLVVLQQFTSR